MKSKSLSFVLGFLFVIVAGAAAKIGFLDSLLVVAVAQTSDPGNASQHESDIAEEEPLPQLPSERDPRMAKNRYFNGGRHDLTRSEDRFIEHYAARMLPTFPINESAIVIVGSLSKIQPYLSGDRTHIYTEMTFRVEDIFKCPPNITRPANGTLVVDRIGGAIRLRSGQAVHDDTDLDIGGKPYVGGRYVVFIKERPEDGPLDILRAYELRDGKVFKLRGDGKAGTVLFSTRQNGSDDPLSEEQKLLQTIRHLILTSQG